MEWNRIGIYVDIDIEIGYRDSVIIKKITTYCFRAINPYELLILKGQFIHFQLLSVQFLSPSPVLTRKAEISIGGVPVQTRAKQEF